MKTKDQRNEIVHTIRNKCCPAASALDMVLRDDALTERDSKAVRLAQKSMHQMLAYADLLAAQMRYDQACEENAEP